MNYVINKQYPLVKVEKKNKYYAKILLDSFAGFISEDTSIHQYIYNYILLKDTNENLSDAFLKISMTEMKHLNILGEIIKLLGVNPIFKTCNNTTLNLTPWNANYINYTTNIKSILLYNIKLETEAVKKYKQANKLINDKYINENIERIIEDEILHINIFKFFLSQLYWMK